MGSSRPVLARGLHRNLLCEEDQTNLLGEMKLAVWVVPDPSSRCGKYDLRC